MKSFTSYDLVTKEFPQRLPPSKLILIKGLSTLSKFGLPLVLESIYKNLEQQNCGNKTQQTLVSILLKITISLSLSYFLELYCEYILVDYRLNLKKQLSKRILQNTILNYIRSKKRSVFHFNQQEAHQDQQHKQIDKQQSFNSEKLSIWTQMSNKMPVYVYNYHNSLLSLFFQSLNIIGVSTYLFMKLSYSIFFGLIFAVLIMKKIVDVTKKMQQRFFNNIELRQKKLNFLKSFFNHLVEYKMTWLDKWIFDKIQKCEDEYQNNLEQIKYLDVWCVALWRFTSVSISSIVVVAFYFLGIQATQTITPSTLISFLLILTLPLNALSWNIAGVRNSLRAINQLKRLMFPLKIQDKTSINTDEKDQVKIIENQQLKIKFDQQDTQEVFIIKHDIPIPQGIFIKAKKEKEVQHFFTILPFILRKKINQQIGYVEENSWQIENILQSLTFKNVQSLEGQIKEFPSVTQLMQIFQCHQIPQFSSITSKNLSGGEKMRINLVRAFFNSKIIIINSDLSSLDLKMRQKVASGIQYLIKNYGYCVFCVQISEIPEETFQNFGQLTFNLKNPSENPSSNLFNFQILYTSKKQNDKKLLLTSHINQKVEISQQIFKKFESSLEAQKSRQSQKEREQIFQRQKLEKEYQQSFDNLKWQTFTSYYKSKYHIVFLIGIICTTFFENLYQFYMNTYVKIQHLHDGSGLTAQNVKYIIILTLLFGMALFVRAYYFAVASIKESKRLSKQLDQNIIMNEIDFYQKFTQSLPLSSSKKNDHLMQHVKGRDSQPRNHNNKTTQLGSKLIYHCTSDIAEVSDNYPWGANILFNNIATTISSILIVFSEIPFIGIILIPIAILTVLWNNHYQKQTQRLLKVQKKVQENLLKTVHEIEQGIKIIYLFHKIDEFKSHVYKSIDKQINIEWKLNDLKRKLNTKYKLMMIGFLVIIVLTFGLTGHIKSECQSSDVLQRNNFQKYVEDTFGQCNLKNLLFSNQQKNKSGKFSMLVSYTITLANFMLFLTVSLGDTFTHALSIERLRPLLSDQNSLKSKQRLSDFEKIIEKVKRATKTDSLNVVKDPMISIKGLNFTYHEKNQNKDQNKKVFNNLDFELKWKQKVELKGKSGDGKTTLYKILCSLYKDKLNTIDYPFSISFSPQHPLILPDTKTMAQNLDPYELFVEKQNNLSFEEKDKKNLKEIILTQLRNNPDKEFQTKNINVINQILDKSLDSLTYEEKIIVNNLRAWLYGKNGIKIYDQPYWVDQSQRQTYIITTHQRKFKHSKSLYLQNKKIIQK